MAADFQQKVKSGGARKASSGFGGHGYTFKDSEKSDTMKLREMQRREYEVATGKEMR